MSLTCIRDSAVPLTLTCVLDNSLTKTADKTRRPTVCDWPVDSAAWAVLCCAPQCVDSGSNQVVAAPVAR